MQSNSTWLPACFQQTATAGPTSTTKIDRYIIYGISRGEMKRLSLSFIKTTGIFTEIFAGFGTSRDVIQTRKGRGRRGRQGKARKRRGEGSL